MTMPSDDRIEMIRVLRQAHDEIVTQRRRLAEVEPKAHAYDTLAIAMRLAEPVSQQGYSIDVAWLVKEAVEKLQAEQAASPLGGNSDAQG